MQHPAWFKRHQYLHFDEPIGVEKARALVEDPQAVSKHAFWPLISYQIKTSKIKKNAVTGMLDLHSKVRPIAYAAHSDSHIFSFYCQLIGNAYEAALKRLDIADVALAFRSQGKNNIHFAKEAFEEIRLLGNCVAVALDISAFFDNIDHALLKKQWKEVIGVSELPPDHYALFKALTKSAVVSRDQLFEAAGVSMHNLRAGGRRRICDPAFFRHEVRAAGLIKSNPNGFGIPQGTAMSALLSNVYMMNFDVAAKQFAAARGGKYMRYCDDMLFILPGQDHAEVERFAESEMTNLKLSLNASKTEVCIFTKSSEDSQQTTSRPLQYLGFLFDGKRILIRSAAFAKFSNQMRRGVRLAKLTMRSRNAMRTQAGIPERDLFLKKIYTLYSHFGGRNFLRYGYKASVIMESTEIRKQLRPLWGRLQAVIQRRSEHLVRSQGLQLD